MFFRKLKNSSPFREGSLTDRVCVCCCCVDPREHGFFLQHRLSPIENGFFMSRTNGAFIPKPSPKHDVSMTGLMLVELHKNPLFVFQGHRDCAAVRILFEAYGKKRSATNDSERSFLRSYGDALKLVKENGAHMPQETQLRILEKICVLQSVNNLFEHHDMTQQPDYWPVLHAYYALSPLTQEQRLNPEKIELMIYDPKQGYFARAEKGNNGIRATDLIDPIGCITLPGNDFEITAPIDIEVAVQKEIQIAASGMPPRVEQEDRHGEYQTVTQITYRG